MAIRRPLSAPLPSDCRPLPSKRSCVPSNRPRSPSRRWAACKDQQIWGTKGRSGPALRSRYPRGASQEDKEHRLKLKHLEQQIKEVTQSLEDSSISDAERLALMEDKVHALEAKSLEEQAYHLAQLKHEEKLQALKLDNDERRVWRGRTAAREIIRKTSRVDTAGAGACAAPALRRVLTLVSKVFNGNRNHLRA